MGFTALPKPTSCFLRLVVESHTLPLICDFSCSCLFIYFFFLKHNSVRKAKILKFKNNPVDTGRKLNVHKMFRRRPGRLLNVLCTFNLCPVSTGKGSIS